MEEFIHCNSCNALPDQTSTRKFFLSACGHIFCQRCKERTVSTGQCCVCNKKSNIMDIGQLDSGMQHMFMDPLALAKKQQRQMAETLNFQKAHRSRFFGLLQHQLKKAKKMQEFASKEAEKRKLLERENQELRQQVAQMKQQLMCPTGLQTPRMASSDPMGRYRNNNLNNGFMTVSSGRTNMTNESVNTMPMGAEAASFRGNQTTSFCRAIIPETPFLDASMSSPGLRFDGLENGNLSRESLNTMIASNNPYDQLWQSNISAMTLGTGSVTPQIRASGRSQNASFMNNIKAAFRRMP